MKNRVDCISLANYIPLIGLTERNWITTLNQLEPWLAIF